MNKQHIQDTFGNIDIYLFDQILKGTYDDCDMILDAGCGTGRNLLYLLKCGANVFGVDQNPEAIAQLRTLAGSFPHIDPQENFKVASVEQLPFESETFDLVISSAVLHFAENLTHFEAMLNSMWEVLKPGGEIYFSGFYETPDLEIITDEARRHGLKYISHKKDKDWVAAKFVK